MLKIRTQFDEPTFPKSDGRQGELAPGFQMHAVESVHVLMARLQGGGNVPFRSPDLDEDLGVYQYDDFFTLNDRLEELRPAEAQHAGAPSDDGVPSEPSEPKAHETSSGVGEEPTVSQS